MMNWYLAWVIAFRELRAVFVSGLRGFRIMILCLAIGVAAISAVGAAQVAVKNAISRDAKSLTGGDVEVRLLYREALQVQIDFFESLGRATRIAELRTMARTNGNSLLVALKAVDSNYPLYGDFSISPRPLGSELFSLRKGRYGAAVEKLFLESSGLKLGDSFRLNKAEFEIRSIILSEPDRGVGLISYGPRVMINHDALKAAGLVLPGSLVTWYHRIALRAGEDAKVVVSKIKDLFGDPGWRLRTYNEAAPDIKRTIDRLGLFLTLAGLAALLVGGVGAANSVKAYMDQRSRTVAILKCLGASADVIFKSYLIQVGMMAFTASIIGASIGSAIPLVFAPIFSNVLGLNINWYLDVETFFLALAYGVLTAFVFTLWPLAAAERLHPADLVRGSALGITGIRPSAKRLALIVLAAIGLIFMAVYMASSKFIAIVFITGAIFAAFCFLLLSFLLIRFIRLAPRFGSPIFRLALSGISRPGAPTIVIILSLGLGLTALTCMTLTEAAFRHQLDERIAGQAPTFFFVDIQPYQRSSFAKLLKNKPGVTLDSEAPMLRARITRVNGVLVEKAKIKKSVQWATQNERGLTFAAYPPKNIRISEGDWWPDNYKGDPLISFDARIADGFGVGVGDTLSFNVLGREITATIKNLRHVNYADFTMNFSTIFDPITLGQVPHTILATATAPVGEEVTILQEISEKFPNVTVVRVKDVVALAKGIVSKISNALVIVAAVAVIAGALTLAGAVAASHNRRVNDAVLLKTAGATRSQIISAYIIEFGLVGAITALLSVMVGTIGAWAIVTYLLQIIWHFSFLSAFIPAALALTLAMCAGGAGIWRALSVAPGSILRNA